MILESIFLGNNAVIVLSRERATEGNLRKKYLVTLEVDESRCQIVSMLSFVPGNHNLPLYISAVIHFFRQCGLGIALRVQAPLHYQQNLKLSTTPS